MKPAVLLNPMTVFSLLGAAVSALPGCSTTPRFAPEASTDTPPTSPGAALPAQRLCPKPLGGENSGPQGRLVRGGCLENFKYFTAEIQGTPVSPPDTLPEIVRGYHDVMGRTIDIHVQADRTDTYIKDRAGRSIATLPLYKVWAETAEGTRRDLCEGAQIQPDRPERDSVSRDLEGRAIAVPGYWDGKGQFQATVQGQRVLTLACVSGAAAKCAHWGYVPWVTYPTGSGTGVKLDGHHKACVRAARAQYVDDEDLSMTCNDTTIDTFDQLGIRSPDEAPAPGRKYEFEAAWGEARLVCLSRARYEGCDTELTRNQILPARRCAREYGLADPWPAGALLMNRSARGKLKGGACPTTAKLCKQ